MIGAVTGRAEAQVMRLSAVYSLLDASSIIQPAHHNAAIALWDYCERSAAWIFGTQTGDRSADKILSALRGAGSHGLTRTQISELFNRNLRSEALSDALRILHDAGHANFQNKPTGGAPVEHWFVAGAHEINELSTDAET